MKKPKLAEIERRLTYGDNFSLTDSQYQKRTGLPLPKRKDYLKKKSALAKLCEKYGYSLEVQEKKVFFIKEGSK